MAGRRPAAPRDPRRRLTAETKYRLLLEIWHRIRGTLELDQILERVLDMVGSVVGFDAAGIFVLNEDALMGGGSRGRQLIAGVAQRGFPPHPAESDPMLSSGKGIVGHTIRSGQPVVAADVRREPHYVAGRSGTLSEITVPITLGGRTIGALNLESDALAAYGKHHLGILRFFADAAAIAIEKAMLHRRLLEKEQLDAQLRVAHEVQSRLLPGSPPPVPGYDLGGLSLPSSEIGGDYFDFLPLANGDLALVIADVSGKGVPAALVMATFRALLRTQARGGASPARTAAAVNRLLKQSSVSRAFVTGVYGILEPASGRFTYVNCGHLAPLLVRRRGGTAELEASGPLLGVFERARFASRSVTMAPGDTLVMFTDGVVEATDRRDEEYGPRRLAAVVRAGQRTAIPALLEQVLRATREHAASPTFDDDFTLAIVRRSPAGRRGAAARADQAAAAPAAGTISRSA